jgi:hypothetical protein
MKTAKELKEIALKVEIENGKRLYESCRIDVEERLMPNLIREAEKGNREMFFTTSKELEIGVCNILRSNGFSVKWIASTSNYKITW